MAEPRNDICVNAFCLVIVFALWLSGFLMAQQGQAIPQTSFTLDESINPNTASVASLLRLSGIGPVRAQAIVTYRHTFIAEHPEQTPFQDIKDLTRVKGLGPRTVDAMRQWLVFE